MTGCLQVPPQQHLERFCGSQVPPLVQPQFDDREKLNANERVSRPACCAWEPYQNDNFEF